MPLTINVGLSRKASEDFQSSGVSLNLTAELDQALLGTPDQLQERIAALYRQAEAAIDRQREGRRNNGAAEALRSPRAGRHDPHGNGRRPRAAMTPAQRRAIEAISEQLDIDPLAECRAVLNAELDALGVREASALIDHLRALQRENSS